MNETAALNANQSQDTLANVKVSMKERLCYALGCGGIMIPFNMILSFMNYFWTDVLGIPMVLVGTFMMFNKIWDAVNDPIEGAIADRTNTKYGKYRPWIFSFIPLIVTTFFLFFRIPGVSQGVQIAFTFTMYFINVVAMTLTEIPHISLMSAITTNYVERGVLASWRQTVANIFVLAMSATFLPIVLAIGGGDQAKGFTPTAGIYLLLSVPFFLICFFGVKERATLASSAEKTSIRESFKCLKGNIPAIMLCAVYFIWGFSGGFISSGSMYFWNYVAGDVEHFSANMSFMMAGGMIAGVAIGLMVKVVKNKRNIGMFSWIIAAATHIIKFFIPVADPSTWWMFDALTFVNGIFGQLGFICVIAMVPDITEYTQLKHGLRVSGFIFACINFMNKLGTSISQGLFSWILAAQNYAPGETQPQNIVTTISAFLTIIPGFVMLLGVVSFFFYKLNRSTHESTLKELGIR